MFWFFWIRFNPFFFEILLSILMDFRFSPSSQSIHGLLKIYKLSEVSMKMGQILTIARKPFWAYTTCSWNALRFLFRNQSSANRFCGSFTAPKNFIRLFNIWLTIQFLSRKLDFLMISNGFWTFKLDMKRSHENFFNQKHTQVWLGNS